MLWYTLLQVTSLVEKQVEVRRKSKEHIDEEDDVVEIR